MSQTTHPSSTTGTSQCDLILAELLSARPGEWVSMTHLHYISGSMNIHSRIADLRKRGHTIEHRNKRVAGRIHSSYRLVAPPPHRSHSSPPSQQTL